MTWPASSRNALLSHRVKNGKIEIRSRNPDCDNAWQFLCVGLMRDALLIYKCYTSNFFSSLKPMDRPRCPLSRPRYDEVMAITTTLCLYGIPDNVFPRVSTAKLPFATLVELKPLEIPSAFCSFPLRSSCSTTSTSLCVPNTESSCWLEALPSIPWVPWLEKKTENAGKE